MTLKLPRYLYCEIEKRLGTLLTENTYSCILKVTEKVINKMSCNEDIDLNQFKNIDYSLCSERPRDREIGLTIEVLSHTLGLIPPWIIVDLMS